MYALRQCVQFSWHSVVVLAAESSNSDFSINASILYIHVIKTNFQTLILISYLILYRYSPISTLFKRAWRKGNEVLKWIFYLKKKLRSAEVFFSLFSLLGIHFLILLHDHGLCWYLIPIGSTDMLHLRTLRISLVRIFDAIRKTEIKAHPCIRFEMDLDQLCSMLLDMFHIE